MVLYINKYWPITLNKKEFLMIFFILLSTIGVILTFVPLIDINFSQLFFLKEQGFIYSNNDLVVFFYEIPKYIIALSLASFIVFLASIFTNKRLFNLNPLVLFYFSLTMLIGPGLIVNATLKDHWGRARPYEIVEFGGDKEFSSPWVINSYDSASFSCGHASAVFGLLPFAFVSKKHRKKMFFTISSFGFASGLGRILQGAHFLSDVFFSFFIVYLVSYLLHQLIFEKKYFELINRRLFINN